MSTDRNAAQAVANLRNLYGPKPAEYMAELKDATEGARNAVGELERDLTPERAERFAILLGGMQRHAASLAEALRRDSQTA